jgi:hypothetical protein
LGGGEVVEVGVGGAPCVHPVVRHAAGLSAGGCCADSQRRRRARERSMRALQRRAGRTAPAAAERAERVVAANHKSGPEPTEEAPAKGEPGAHSSRRHSTSLQAAACCSRPTAASAAAAGGCGPGPGPGPPGGGSEPAAAAAFAACACASSACSAPGRRPRSAARSARSRASRRARSMFESTGAGAATPR